MCRKLIVVISLFFFMNTLAQQQYYLKKGAITDGLAIVNDSLQETYAIYLPTKYSVENPPGILIVLNEKGKGREVVSYLKKIAEEQNYVIAATNTPLKTDNVEKNVLQNIRFVNSVLTTINIDPKQVFIAGKGKGAISAIFLTQLNFPIAGILPINRAWINSKTKLAESFIGFSAIVGSRDYERDLVGDVAEFYEDKDKASSITLFNGGPNVWPDLTSLYNATSALTMAAMQANMRKKDTILLDTFFKSDVKAIRQLKNEKAYYLAWEQFQNMEAKYEHYNDRFKDKLKQLKRELRKNKGVRKQRRSYYNVAEEEEFKKNDFLSFLEMDVLEANFDNISWWASQVNELETKKDSTDQVQANMAYRLLDYLDALSKTKFLDIKNSNFTIDNKIFTSIIRTLVKPKDPEPYFEIIKLAGHDGDYQTALLYMEDLLKTGFSEFDEFYKVEGILDLQMGTKFNQLIKKYGGEPKYSILNISEEEKVDKE